MTPGTSKRKLQAKTKEERMFTGQQITGPRAPRQYDPMQVSGPSAYYPTQTTDPTGGMFSAMMPMIMMVLMMAMIMPMMKGVTASARD
jgi:hypothetical protein